MKSFFGFHAFTFLCCSPHSAAARMLSELMVNAKEAVAGFLWATAMVEKPELAKLKTRAAKP
jgi:hypothetical protein